MHIASNEDSKSARPCPHLVAAAQLFGGLDSNQRDQRRIPVTLPCRIHPIDFVNQPIGEPIEAITTDISPNGISLLLTSKIKLQRVRLAITSSSGDMRILIAEVIRCDKVSNYYRIAAKLLKKG